jgi:hypothetical protein
MDIATVSMVLELTDLIRSIVDGAKPRSENRGIKNTRTEEEVTTNHAKTKTNPALKIRSYDTLTDLTEGKKVERTGIVHTTVRPLANDRRDCVCLILV